MSFGGPRGVRPDHGGGAELTEEQTQKLLALIVRIFIVFPIILFVLMGVLGSFYTVQAEERAVVRRLGKFTQIADPGLHFKFPFGIDTVSIVATERVLKEEFGFRTTTVDGGDIYPSRRFGEESLMLTGDLNVIDVSWVVQYRIVDPQKTLFNIRDHERVLRDVSEAVVRRIVGNRIGSDVLTIGRVAISSNARIEIQETLDSLESGILIKTVELQDVVPPARVQPAFNDVNVARQMREQMINEAEKRRNQRIPLTEGQALQVIEEAEGYAAERVNRAEGDAARFLSILAQYEQAPLVTRQRLYLEAISQVLPTAGRVLVMQQQGTSPIPLINLDGNIVREVAK